MRGLLLLLVALLLGWTTAVTAAAVASCLEEAERLAARYKLTFLAPMTSPHSGAPAAATAGETPPATADARGALAAPDTRIEPGATAPGGALDGTPAPPQIGSGSSPPPAAAPPPPPLQPAQRARMEELVSRARAAELAGRSDECFRDLRDAQSIASENQRPSR